MRLFIALPLSGGFRDALLEAQRALKRQGARGNFSREENLHLTLAFLGETERVREAREALLSLEAGAFPLTLRGAGRFGDLWWAGVAESAPLADLAAAVRRSLAERGLPCDPKPFRAHITLARRLEAPRPPRLELPELTMEADRVLLMRSERVDGKLVYTPIAERRLK